MSASSLVGGTAPLGDAHRSPRRAERRLLDRSCEACHRRKVRCDKQFPCAACTRGRLACTYQAPAQHPIRRARKTTMADVASRISDLEKTLATTKHSPTSISQSPAPIKATNSIATTASPTPSRSSTSFQGLPSSCIDDDILLRNGSSSQYFNEPLLSRVIEEDADKTSLLGTPEDEPELGAANSAFKLMGILSDPASFGSSEHGQWLSKWSAMQLWQAYIQNVDISVKVLHIPTAEVMVFAAIDNPASVAKDFKALVYSIFFAAAVSIRDHEVLPVLGTDRSTALRRLKSQFNQSLAEADPLENPSMLCLKAIVIHLAVIRSQNESRGVWIMHGLALRLGQSMGLHREGSKLGVSPFETEMRRRLWWHLLCRDYRAAEDHGLNSILSLPPFDTYLPLNVDDSDLRPDMTELPPPRAVWTVMTLPVLLAEITKTWRHLMVLTLSADSHDSKEAVRREETRALRARLEDALECCNPIIPVQSMTMIVSKYVLHKMEFMTRRHFVHLRQIDYGKRLSSPLEEDLITACECLESQAVLWNNELFQQWRWSMLANPQFHMMLYLLWHLCLRPEGPNVDRAWTVMHAAMEVAPQKQYIDPSSKPSLKAVVTQRLKKRAELIRYSLRNGGPQGDRHRDGHELRLAGDDDEHDSRRVIPENSEWSSIMQILPDLPDWNTLVQDLRMDSDEFDAYC